MMWSQFMVYCIINPEWLSSQEERLQPAEWLLTKIPKGHTHTHTSPSQSWEYRKDQGSSLFTTRGGSATCSSGLVRVGKSEGKRERGREKKKSKDWTNYCKAAGTQRRRTRLKSLGVHTNRDELEGSCVTTERRDHTLNNKVSSWIYFWSKAFYALVTVLLQTESPQSWASGLILRHLHTNVFSL